VEELVVGSLLQVYPLHPTLLHPFDDMFFPDDGEVRLVCDQREHDQVSVCPVEAVPGVGVIVFLELQLSDVIHHLVLALSWHRPVRKHHLVKFLIVWISVELVLNEEG